MPFRKIKNIAVVCHDAGSANIIIANLLDTGRRDWLSYMRGPAEKLWNAAYPEGVIGHSLAATLEGADYLISGTGWATDIEHDARKLARSRGIRTAAVIDHWVNYSERFIRNGEEVWPDEFWVTDDYAMEIAKRTFLDQTVRMVPNLYIEKQLRDIASLGKSDAPELLYVLEPMRSNWGRDIPGEFQALDFFISCLPQLGLPPSTVIRIRPHPSDSPGKYDKWIARHSSLNIQMDDTLHIAQSIGRSSWVAGCESFALVLAIMAGRKVYCTLPPYAPACRLPHSGLIHLATRTSATD